MSETTYRLRLLGMPSFSTIEELASLIHIDFARLRLLVSNPECFYRRFCIPKRSGGHREICSPSKEVKAIQAWILRNILDRLSPSPYATAYVKGRKLTDNVVPHQLNRYFLCLDITDFFPSISQRQVNSIFEAVGYSRSASSIMSKICCYTNGLPQGGVTSPALSNLVCLRLDRRLAGLAARRNIIYTRYADDITFSSNNRNALCRLIPIANEILKSERFAPNRSKLRVLGPRINCRITGLVKNASEARFGVGKAKKILMRAAMHNLLIKEKPFQEYPTESSIEGWLSFVRSVDELAYNQMEKYWGQKKKDQAMGE